MLATSKMKKVSFSAGKNRQVCVNRPAIQENMRTHKNYPTILVVEDGNTRVSCCRYNWHFKFRYYSNRSSG